MEEVPFEDRHIAKAEIAWERSAWWWHPLTRSIHPATKLTTLVLGLLALWLAKAGIAAGNWLFQPTQIDGTLLLPTSNVAMPSSTTAGLLESPLLQWLGDSFSAVFSLDFGLNEIAFVSFCAIWLTCVFSMLGGVLARRAMVELGQHSVAPWGESFRIVLSRWSSFLWATGMHLVGLSLLLIPFALLGLVAATGTASAHIAGVLLLLGIPAMFAVGRMTMSMIVCFPLSVCAIAAEEKADAFEGFSRSNAYLFQRPVLAVLCSLLLFAFGLIGEQLVYWTLTFGWSLIRNVFLLTGGGVQPITSSYIATGTWLTGELVGAYWFSFFWAAAGALYLILRKSVDSTELHRLDSIENPVASTLPDIPKSPPTAVDVPAKTEAADTSAEPAEQNSQDD